MRVPILLLCMKRSYFLSSKSSLSLSLSPSPPPPPPSPCLSLPTPLSSPQLDRNTVANIHLMGGSFLGVSRGGSKTSDIVDAMQVRNNTISRIHEFRLKHMQAHMYVSLKSCACRTTHRHTHAHTHTRTHARMHARTHTHTQGRVIVASGTPCLIYCAIYYINGLVLILYSAKSLHYFVPKPW